MCVQRLERAGGEIDGEQKYRDAMMAPDGPAEAVIREKRREDELRDLGHDMVRWTWAELTRPALYHRIGRKVERAQRRST